MTEIVFEQPAASTLARRRGRPEKFTPEIRAALAARPGEFAVIQTGLKSASRASVLKRNFEAQGFEFLPEKTEDGTFKIFARAVAPVEVEVEVEATPEPVAETEPEAPKAAAKRTRRTRASETPAAE